MGNAKFKADSTFIISGIIKDSTFQLDFKIIFKRPDKIRFEEKSFELKREVITIYDGEKGWKVNPNDKYKYPTSLYLNDFDSIRTIISDLDDRLFNYEEKGYNALLLSPDTSRGKKVYIIKLIRPFGNEYKYFLDTETYLPVKIESKEKHKRHWYKTTTYQSSYKDFSGFIYPTKHVTYGEGRIIYETTISSIELNRILPDSLFVLPGYQKGKSLIIPTTKQIWKKLKSQM